MAYCNAFILSFSDFGDYDRRVALLTPEHGKLNAICKSVLRPAAKLAGHLDIPSLSWMELVWSVRGWQITQALELESFSHARANPGALRAILGLAARFDRLLFAEDDREYKGRLASADADSQNQNLYLLWSSFLKTLDRFAEQNVKADYAFLRSQGAVRLLRELGFLPDTFVCARCNRAFTSKFIAYHENQLYCEPCAQALSLSGFSFPRTVLDLMQQGLRGVWFPESTYAEPYTALARLFEQQSILFML